MADMYRIEVKGVKELQNTFKLISKDIEEIVTDGVRDGGKVVKDAAKAKVHVVTGDLRKSIDELHVIKSSGRTEVQVGSALPYATVEEFRVGGKYPGSHSYMRYALDNNEKQVVSAIENKIKTRFSRYK